MKWMIEVTVCIFVTSITGTLLFGIWYTVGKLLEKAGFINVMYELLKAVLLFWFLPVSYMVLLKMNHEKWGGVLFRYTPFLGTVCLVFNCVWLITAFILSGIYIKDVVGAKRKYKSSVPVGEDIYETFLNICKELGIREGKVDLVYDSTIESPCIGGFFKGYIFLPTEEYTPRQLHIILTHELVHYRQKNHIMRHFTEIARIIHFLNPFYEVFRRKVHYWGEYACDFEAITRMQNKKEYCSTLLELSESHDSDYELGSFLFGSKDETINRINLVKRSYKMKKSKFFALFIVLVMVTLSTTSVQAATVKAGDAYYNYYVDTSSNIMESEVEVEGVEYTANGFEDGFIMRKEPRRLINPLDLSTYSWTVNASRIQSSYDFKVYAGQSISVSCTCSPNTAQFRMGIIEPNGTLRYVVGTGATAHNFAITYDGMYAVYVQNMSSGTISVAGSYNAE